MNDLDFPTAFEALTGNPPFPWQTALYERFVSDRTDNIPKSCNLPTGLGKTSVIAIWLIALANFPDKMPRRLVYVVNRRTVVDQTTEEVEKYAFPLSFNAVPISEVLLGLSERLRTFSADATSSPLALSTLRGQFADNREWSADPSRPAVICGTVDMIGSRLLFSGYGVGFKGKPLHAGFLGQDALLVHDEAHLEPAFQELIVAIEEEQKRCKDFKPLRVMELTATSRGDGEAFTLTKEEKDIPENLPAKPTLPIHYVWQRMTSKKALKFYPSARDALAKSIGDKARDLWKDSGKAILIFVRTIKDVKAVQQQLIAKNVGVLPKQVQILTGTMRGLERDRLAETDPIFARFMPNPKVAPAEGTVYLICTSAGEVGVDISADHMVCDLSTLDSMAQRFGRVNRRGEGDAHIDVVYETDRNPKPASPEFEAARWATKTYLERLALLAGQDERRDASPHGLGTLMKSLTDTERDVAFAPKPTILPTTDILFDAWALTTIKGKLPGRPPVEPYLHGLPTAWQPPETHVAWREEVGKLTPTFESNRDKREFEKYAAELIDDYPLKPHELLREPNYRAFEELEKIARRRPDDSVWLLDDDGTVQVLSLKVLADKDKKDRIDNMTVLLPPSAGGINEGMLNGATDDPANDVADEWYSPKERKRLRIRILSDDEECDVKTENMGVIRKIDLTAPDADEDAEHKSWHWCEVPYEGGKNSKLPVLWSVHVKDVVDRIGPILANLPLGENLIDALTVAAKFHDHGKRRKTFQTVLGNSGYPTRVLAKSGKKGGRIAEQYRHEFGSLSDFMKSLELPPGQALSDSQEFILHVIATHHGRGRPHFAEDEAFDPQPPQGIDPDKIAAEVPRRFAKLQRKYGRWGLAYLESLLRAADYAASANPSAFEKEGDQ